MTLLYEFGLPKSPKNLSPNKFRPPPSAAVRPGSSWFVPAPSAPVIFPNFPQLSPKSLFVPVRPCSYLFVFANIFPQARRFVPVRTCSYLFVYEPVTNPATSRGVYTKKNVEKCENMRTIRKMQKYVGECSLFNGNRLATKILLPEFPGTI